MKVVNQQDRVLIGGLVLALIVVFARPIQYLLDLARDVERSSGLALMPALLILIGVFFFHQQGKRQESKAQAAAAEADATQAEARAVEMERLVTFGQGLGRALEVETIRDVVVQHLPKLAGTDDAWCCCARARTGRRSSAPRARAGARSSARASISPTRR